MSITHPSKPSRFHHAFHHAFFTRKPHVKHYFFTLHHVFHAFPNLTPIRAHTRAQSVNRKKPQIRDADAMTCSFREKKRDAERPTCGYVTEKT